METLSYRDINRIVFFTGVLGLLNGILRYLLPLSLIFYGWSLYEYGLLYFVQAFAMAVPMILGGFSTDLNGRKSTIALSLVLFSVGTYMYADVISGNNLTLLIVAQILTTVSFGITRMGLSILMADVTKMGHDRTKFLSIQAGVRSFSAFVGPLLFGVILEYGNITLFSLDIYESAFLILTFLSLFGFSFVYFLPRTDPSILILNRDHSLRDMNKQERQIQYAFGVEEVILGFTSGLIVPFIDYYVLTEFQPSDIQWAVLAAVGNIGIAIGSFSAGFVAEGYGKAKFVIRSNLAVPFLALGITLAPSFILVSVFYVARQALANLIHPIWESWYFSHTQQNIRGRSLSLIQVSRRLSRSLGVAAGPASFALLGPAIFPIACIMYPVAMGIPAFVERKLS